MKDKILSFLKKYQLPLAAFAIGILITYAVMAWAFPPNERFVASVQGDLDQLRKTNIYKDAEIRYYRRAIDLQLAQNPRYSISDSLNYQTLENTILQGGSNYTQLHYAIQLMHSQSANLPKIPSIMPLKRGAYAQVTSSFGQREHPIHKEVALHAGLDIAANYGTPVFSSAAGMVAEVQRGNTGLGNWVRVQHEFGFETVYGHLSNITVEAGKAVVQGETIGFVGNSGLSTGPHLHYEVRKNSQPLDPYPFTKITGNIMLQEFPFGALAPIAKEQKKVADSAKAQEPKQ